jgi:ubiquinone/menaquinone biosynthesis C-methylase UbiE
MSVKETYNDWSGTYDTDENLTRDLDQVVTRDSLGSYQFESVLEIGCGTGKNTAFLSQIAEGVHALDFSEGMLTKAKGKPWSNKVTFSVADITKPWPQADKSVDLVVCTLVLEHIEDLGFVFAEAYRSLVEGGLFFISELHPFQQYQGVKARFQSDQGKIEIQAFVHHVSDYFAAAKENGFLLLAFREWWHEEDLDEPPRLASFMFKK